MTFVSGPSMDSIDLGYAAIVAKLRERIYKGTGMITSKIKRSHQELKLISKKTLMLSLHNPLKIG
jgi:hypothetical protein